MLMNTAELLIYLIENIKDPVDGIEEEEADGEDDPGVGVDDVDVADLRHGRLDDGGSAPQRVHHLRLARRPVCKNTLILLY